MKRTNELQPMDAQALRLFTRSTLLLLGGRMWSQEAEELLMGTCAQESHLGTYRRQIGDGPARGIFQIEPETERSLWEDYLNFRPALAVAVANICGVKGPDVWALEKNLSYQIIMCRLRYYAWVKAPIPGTLNTQAAYWKEHYNTSEGAGKVEEYISNYRRFLS